jgi:hypothetical protein
MAEEPRKLAEDDLSDIRSDIERTRTRIAATVDAIESRLRPGRLMANARKTISEATARRAEAVRLHPVHTTLVVLGILVITGEILRRRRQGRLEPRTRTRRE